MLGFDIGGTFTDLALYDSTSETFRITKVPSNAADPADALSRGLAELGVSPDQIATVMHGTTVTTNALIERRGARVCLVTTEGFRDLIEIGRTMRMVPGLFNTKFVRAEPLVPRERRIEVKERTLSSGEILISLTSEEIERVIAAIQQMSAQSVAICLLNSYRSQEHEQRLCDELTSSLPGLYVVASSQVISEFREYERFNTTAVMRFSVRC